MRDRINDHVLNLKLFTKCLFTYSFIFLFYYCPVLNLSSSKEGGVWI